MKTQTVPAYAKLNLTLDILGKRLDGYHELRMVMQTVSLCDDVTVTLTDGTGIACRVAGAELPCDERNLPNQRRTPLEALQLSLSGIDITSFAASVWRGRDGGRQRGCCRRAVRAARSDRTHAHGRAA